MKNTKLKTMMLAVVALSASLFLWGQPIRSIVSARSTNIIADEIPFDCPYVTDGLIAIWDGLTADGRIREWTGHFSDMSVEGELYEEDGMCVAAVDSVLTVDNSGMQGLFDEVFRTKSGGYTVEWTIDFSKYPYTENTYPEPFVFGYRYFLRGYIFLRGGAHRDYGCAGILEVPPNVPWKAIPPIAYHCVSYSGEDNLADVIWAGGNISQSKEQGVQSGWIDRLAPGKDLHWRIVQSAITVDLTAGCRFGSIRVYNRPLTREEIEFNYQIDKERFGI
jgi:hypothetical protein